MDNFLLLKDRKLSPSLLNDLAKFLSLFLSTKEKETERNLIMTWTLSLLDEKKEGHEPVSSG